MINQEIHCCCTSTGTRRYQCMGCCSLEVCGIQVASDVIHRKSLASACGVNIVAVDYRGYGKRVAAMCGPASHRTGLIGDRQAGALAARRSRVLCRCLQLGQSQLLTRCVQDAHAIAAALPDLIAKHNLQPTQLWVRQQSTVRDWTRESEW